eukprot:m.3318 g.3318  ORF g.3318 m.3318 type:complete len:265 (-) comp1487_c0_seq1:196-990(-)
MVAGTADVAAGGARKAAGVSSAHEAPLARVFLFVLLVVGGTVLLILVAQEKHGTRDQLTGRHTIMDLPAVTKDFRQHTMVAQSLPRPPPPPPGSSSDTSSSDTGHGKHMPGVAANGVSPSESSRSKNNDLAAKYGGDPGMIAPMIAPIVVGTGHCQQAGLLQPTLDLSVVLATRNDMPGTMLQRLANCLHTFSAFDWTISVEIVVVVWNEMKQADSLKKQLENVPALPRRLDVRYVIVPEEFHTALHRLHQERITPSCSAGSWV